MGNGTFTRKNYHTKKGYLTGSYISSPGCVAYRMLIVPLDGFEGPFFYVKELGNGKFEITGEYYEHQKDWKESMQGYREEIANTVSHLNSSGRLGYFFIGNDGQVLKKEWVKYQNDCVKNDKQWFLTDDDCFQCCRIIKPNNSSPALDGVYEFVQVNRSGSSGTENADKHVISHGIIDMNDYTETQVLEYLKLFGHTNFLDFLSLHEDSCCQLVAEMIFETNWHDFKLPGTYPSFADACKKVNRITGIKLDIEDNKGGVLNG
jgi:hypothetical protein